MSKQEPSATLSAEKRAAALRDIQAPEKALIVPAAKLLSGDRSTTQALIQLLQHEKRPENRQGILYALAWHGSLDTWQPALKILADTGEDPVVRGQAAEVIAYLFLEQAPESEAFQAAVEVLKVAAHDPSPEVRYCVANTLGCSGYLPLMPALQAMLGDRVAAPGWVGTVADEAARALDWIVGMSEQRAKRAKQTKP